VLGVVVMELLWGVVVVVVMGVVGLVVLVVWRAKMVIGGV
jgi:hypothetical protein